MPKTPVVLVTFHRRGSDLGRTIAFNAFTRKPIPQFCRHNRRPYESSSAAIRRSGTHEDMAAFWGVRWLESWGVRPEIVHHHDVHGAVP
jgi:hypothetical protein